MREQMKILFDWYKANHYSQGDNYFITYSPGSDLWIIGHSNDYPMQHGQGSSVRLNTAEIDKIIDNYEKNKP
jgi:hypothetical protein